MPVARKEFIGGKYDERKLVFKIAKRFEQHGFYTSKEYLKDAWAILKFEKTMDWHQFCWLFHNQRDLNGDDPYVLQCAEGDNPYSWVDNEVDRWNDYIRALEKKDYPKLVNFIRDISL